jgi:Tol biopolymer transport system component
MEKFLLNSKYSYGDFQMIYRLIHSFFIILTIALFTKCSEGMEIYNPMSDTLRFSGEYHLRNVKQLTFGGNNAEAYWSFNGNYLVFQSDWEKINPQGCDQIFIMNSDGSKLSNGNIYQLVSTGQGRTTCAYFLKTKEKIVYASTHEADEKCPDSQMFFNGKYVWPIYSTYNIYSTDYDGTNTEKLIASDYYDAESTISPDGKHMIFTSMRSGDLELWRYEFETEKLFQLTNELGYDGGAFFSNDSRKIVWRASRPV